MSEQANQPPRRVRQLTNDIHEIYDSLGRLETNVDRLAQAQEAHSVRFAGVEARLDALAVGQQQLREKVDTVDIKVGVVDTGVRRVLVLLGEPTE